MEQPQISKAGVVRLSYDLAALSFAADYLPAIDADAIEKALPAFLRELGIQLPFDAPRCAGCEHFSPHTATGGCGTEVRDGERTKRCGCLARNDDDPAGDNFAKHTHDNGKLPWGKKKPLGECRRCDQLRAGATPREAHPALQAAQRRRDNEEQTTAAMRDHFAPGGPHATGTCGPVCTAFDY
jgi:hypothetical protein